MAGNVGEGYDQARGKAFRYTPRVESIRLVGGELQVLEESMTQPEGETELD